MTEKYAAIVVQRDEGGKLSVNTQAVGYDGNDEVDYQLLVALTITHIMTLEEHRLLRDMIMGKVQHYANVYDLSLEDSDDSDDDEKSDQD